jgi:hypothetical protein
MGKLFNVIFSVAVVLYIIDLTIRMSFLHEIISTNQVFIGLSGIILIIYENIINEIKNGKN